MKNLILKLAAALALASALGLASCGGEEGSLSSSDAAVVGVGLGQGAVTITVGATGTLTAFVYPSNAADKGVSWVSSAPAVATVTGGEGGRATVTAMAAGTTTITVTTRDGGRTASCRVTVDDGIVHVASLDMPQTMALAPDMSEMLTVGVRPANATNKDVTWASSNAAVAAVAPLGAGSAFVVAKTAGTATITATAADGGATATCAITVTPYDIPVIGIRLSKDKLNVLFGYKGALVATLQPTNATGQITWTSSNTGVATVTASGATASVLSVTPGTTTVTATCAGLSATCTVTVAEGGSAVTMLPSTLTEGSNHTLGIKEDGSLWAWGGNYYGQLGLAVGDRDDRNRPTRVGNDNDWASVQAGNEYTLALKEDGSLWAWGRNLYGQTGLPGVGTDYYEGPVYTPTRVGTDTDWAALAVSSGTSMALKVDGTLWAWGYNGNGQMGLGYSDWEYDGHPTPAQVGTDDDWAAVSMGTSHVLAVKTDGSLWAWGNNGYGQLGFGFDSYETFPPTRVDTASDWATPQAGAYHSVVLKTDGSLYICGENYMGSLGLGDYNWGKVVSFTRLDSYTYKHVSGGYYHYVAIRSNDRLYVWGDNRSGQLGLGWQDYDYHPVVLPIGSDTDWACVVAECSSVSLALKSDGRLYTWGQGGNGQLGIGSWGDNPYVTNADSGYRVPSL
jgi:alpha-tubulin suppressor-like RCC1 family protein/uncharacterized protein YjdB